MSYLVFSSLEFIFRFLPVFLILYYLTPHKYKNIVLFIGSLCFYAFGDLKYLFFILLSVLVNYTGGILIERSVKSKQLQKLWLSVMLFYDLGMLFFFKYFNFLIEIIRSLAKGISAYSSLQPISVGLPLGISFYTFHAVSYIADVYRGKVKADQSLLCLGLYLCMFPKLISGPIAEYPDILKQIKSRNYSLYNLEKGLKLFTIGLGFKVLIADRIGILWHDIQTIGFESISTPLAWLGAFGYSLQLYFDFAGYSYMAIGVGKMLGFSLPVNFAHPYISKSVTEFYRRWHITLGEWFKNYVYIPLGGNRKGIIRLALNLLIVWLLTGLWHGAGWNFILWGFVLFLFILIEKLFLKRFLDRTHILSRIYLLTVIPLSWMLFAITRLSDIKVYFGRLFLLTPGICVNPNDFIKYLNTYKWLFLAGIFFSMPFALKWYTRHENSIPCIILLLLVFWFCVCQLVNGMNNPFLYFRF